MKKLGLLVMPLMAVSFLTSCGGASQVIEHFVTFESNGGSHINTQRVKDGGVATDPGASTRPGYNFEGWYTTNPNPTPIEDDKYDFDTKVTDDITLYAGWKSTSHDSYLVDFDGADCGAQRVIDTTKTPFSSDNIEEGTEVTLEIAPEAGSEYHFDLDDTITFLVNGEPSTAYTYTKVTGTDKYSLVFTVTGKTEIYASTTEYCWLTYVCESGTKDPEKIERGSTLEGHLGEPVISEEEVEFVGWFYDSTFKQECKPSQKIYEDTTIYGRVVPREKSDPLTFTCADDGGDGGAIIRLVCYNDFDDVKSFTRNLKYRINEGEWTPIEAADENGNFNITFPKDEDTVYVNILPESITLEKDDKIQFAGNNETFSYCEEDVGYFTMSFETEGYSGGKFNVSGNVMSLLSSEGFGALTEIPEDGCFISLFSGSWGNLGDSCNIVNAKDLMLPATKLTYYCYESMFEGHSTIEYNTLKTAPELLPATELAKECYDRMFHDCSALIEGPIILATTGAEKACYEMFYGCKSLESLTVAFGEGDEWLSGERVTSWWLQNAGSTSTTPKFYWKGSQNPSSSLRDFNHIPENWDIQPYTN